MRHLAILNFALWPFIGAARFQQSFFANSIEMVNQGKDGDDIQYMQQDNSAEERQQGLLAARGAQAGVGEKAAEAQRKADANCRPTDKQKGKPYRQAPK